MPNALLALALTATTASGTPDAPSVHSAPAKEKKPLLAAGLNWVVPGAGYIYNGRKPACVTVLMTVGAAGLTYIESVHSLRGGTLRRVDPTAFADADGTRYGAELRLKW